MPAARPAQRRNRYPQNRSCGDLHVDAADHHKTDATKGSWAVVHGERAKPPKTFCLPSLCGVVHVARLGDTAVAALAAAQSGVVSRRQLQAAGLGRGAIAHRLAEGRLHRLHRGVYLVGHAVAPAHAHQVAALLACQGPSVGDGNAVLPARDRDRRSGDRKAGDPCGGTPTVLLSHRSAAALWGLARPPADAVDVTVVGRDCGRRAGIRDYRVLDLADADWRLHEGLPVTAPARTLLDLASVVDERTLERALNEGLVQRLTTIADLRAALTRSQGRPGTPAIRRVMPSSGTALGTASCRRSGFASSA
jgi:hypothetical protein